MMSQRIKISTLLLFFIALFGATSFVDISTGTVLDGKIIFEILLLLIGLWIFLKFKIHKEVYIYSVFIFIYIFYSLGYYILFEMTAKFTDYLIMYKAFIYLFILSLFVGKQYLDQGFLRKLFNLLLILFLCKYILMYIFSYGSQVRPALFVENNYELMMLLIIYVGVYSREKVAHKYDISLLFIVLILCGSRSGLGSFLVLVFFLKFGKYESIKNKLVKLVLLVLGSIGLFYVFYRRLGSGSIEDIDRVRFFLYFLNEIDSWNIGNYLLGAPFMTPMSYETSNALYYYHDLYSDHGKLLTYSIVLHSFILRVIFDHGFLGFLFSLFVVWKFLSLSDYTRNERLLLLSMLLVNGLSVSSLNSVFVILSLGLIIITKRPDSLDEVQISFKSKIKINGG